MIIKTINMMKINLVTLMVKISNVNLNLNLKITSNKLNSCDIRYYRKIED